MTSYVALLRAVNVGGTGKLSMTDLIDLCAAAGFESPGTYIASGNALLRSGAGAEEVRAALGRHLAAHTGRRVGILIRTASELAETAARNPFADRPGSRVGVLFTDAPLPDHPLDGASGLGAEEVRNGRREIFVYYPNGVGRTRLRLPAEQTGTMRNMNTVSKLAELAIRLE